jgi:hypothetical protein
VPGSQIINNVLGRISTLATAKIKLSLQQTVNAVMHVLRKSKVRQSRLQQCHSPSVSRSRLVLSRCSITL